MAGNVHGPVAAIYRTELGLNVGLMCNNFTVVEEKLRRNKIMEQPGL